MKICTRVGRKTLTDTSQWLSVTICDGGCEKREKKNWNAEVLTGRGNARILGTHTSIQKPYVDKISISKGWWKTKHPKNEPSSRKWRLSTAGETTNNLLLPWIFDCARKPARQRRRNTAPRPSSFGRLVASICANYLPRSFHLPTQVTSCQSWKQSAKMVSSSVHLK